MKRQTLIAVTALFAVAASTAIARAQLAGFTLFGEPTPEAAEVAKEHRFVHPITAPYFHEDSFVTNDIRAWYLLHDFSGLVGGGHADVFAVQARLALTNQIQFVAYKDGYADFSAPGLTREDGRMDLGAGIKWNCLQDWENQFHMAVGAGYEFVIGDDDIFQGDDEWCLWLSVNKGFDRVHLGATLNIFLADDESQGLGNSDHLSWHVHADYYVCEFFSPVVEFNGYHVIDEGGAPLAFSGVDVANLGGGDDEPVVTFGVGAEFRPIDNLGLRFAYETPLTDSLQLFGHRWTFSLVFSF